VALSRNHEHFFGDARALSGRDRRRGVLRTDASLASQLSDPSGSSQAIDCDSTTVHSAVSRSLAAS
jgi:hypothetical protein